MEPIDHLDLVVSDLERSLRFYADLLRPLGYTTTSEIVGERGERVVYVSRPNGHGQVSVRERRSEGEVDRYALGLHHLAFSAPSREVVDERAAWLREQGHSVESGPRDYDYAPEYYAVFFLDPDGIKLELVHNPHEALPGPRVVWMPGGVRTEIQLTARDTGGAFCLLADEPPPGWSLPPHRHANESETIHVVAGRFEVDIGGETRLLEPGDTAHVPRGVVHSGRAVGDETGRRVVIFSPAGIEAFFAETGAANPGASADVAKLLASAERHGWEFVR